MKTKEGKDVSIEQITAENYVVPKGEELHFHVKLEIGQRFNPMTGERISKPTIQKFGLKEWSGLVATSLRKQGYVITVLHDPRTVIEQYKVEQARKAEAARIAEAERAEQEREALKKQLRAELLEELKAEMKAEKKSKDKEEGKTKDEK